MVPPSPRAAASLFVLFAALGCSKGPAAGAKTRPPPLVKTARVEARDVAIDVKAPVDLRPIAQADVGSKTLGYLDAVLVDRGDRVRKGQPLALVRPSDLPDQLAVARGALAQSKAQHELARANYERAAKLAPNGVVSQQELSGATTALAQAEAAESAARAQIDALGVRIGETRIESPLDGFVVARRLDPGALVGPPGGGAIVTVARTDVLRVFVAVGERDAARVAVGKEAHLEVDALPGRRFSGKVVRLSPSFDPTTRTLDAEVHLANESGDLRAGMFGRCAITVDVHAGALVVPVEGVQISAGKRYAFVVRADKAERRAVETGYDGGDWLEIQAGLAAGEEIVVEGADALSNGAALRVAPPASAAAPPAASSQRP